MADRQRRLAAIEKHISKRSHGKVVIYLPDTQPRSNDEKGVRSIHTPGGRLRGIAAVALPHNFRDPLPGQR